MNNLDAALFFAIGFVAGLGCMALTVAVAYFVLARQHGAALDRPAARYVRAQRP